jgi:hypothetical protein
MPCIFMNVGIKFVKAVQMSVACISLATKPITLYCSLAYLAITMIPPAKLVLLLATQ